MLMSFDSFFCVSDAYMWSQRLSRSARQLATPSDGPPARYAVKLSLAFSALSTTQYLTAMLKASFLSCDSVSSTRLSHMRPAKQYSMRKRLFFSWQPANSICCRAMKSRSIQRRQAKMCASWALWECAMSACSILGREARRCQNCLRQCCWLRMRCQSISVKQTCPMRNFLRSCLAQFSTVEWAGSGKASAFLTELHTKFISLTDRLREAICFCWCPSRCYVLKRLMRRSVSLVIWRLMTSFRSILPLFSRSLDERIDILELIQSRADGSAFWSMPVLVVLVLGEGSVCILCCFLVLAGALRKQLLKRDLGG